MVYTPDIPLYGALYRVHLPSGHPCTGDLYPLVTHVRGDLLGYLLGTPYTGPPRAYLPPTGVLGTSYPPPLLGGVLGGTHLPPLL